MATLVLSAVGASVGSAVGGSVLGLTSTVIGRAVGATIGRVIDMNQQVLGAGSQAVETGQIDRFRLAGASEGAAVPMVWGAMRVGSQVIWSSRFLDTTTTSTTGGTGGGGKGGGGGASSNVVTTTEHSYSVSVALALCEGEITRVGRVWADGVEVGKEEFNMRVYSGAADQLPDPKIEAVEGAGTVPAYRGLAYVVIEDLQLGRFGNRVPQFSFEVIRPAQGEGVQPLQSKIPGVAIIPGTGEYSLATTPVHSSYGVGQNASSNVNTPAGKTDFAVSLEQLSDELPGCGSGLLVVSWFGDDLRCNQCQIKPKVEQADFDGVGMAWNVSGQTRSTADLVPKDADDRSIYGGTPTDQSVIEAIAAMQAVGKDVTFYPFVLMDQVAENGRADPYSDNVSQPVMPWRGRITSSKALGQVGSPDGTAAADAEVAAFFGTAQASDFTVGAGSVIYSGPSEWGFRRFILHNAALCAAAGGVEAFVIGSEMRGLTQIRGAGNSFPSVTALQALAAEVRALLPSAKIGYAADWSEYFGYHPQDGSGDVFFHLDALWADGNIDFIGIDNYMPLSDWRDGLDHADAVVGSIYNALYLQGNVEGGEGYDWYYNDQADRDAQVRRPIVDGAHREDWIYRYKDIRNWWQNAHHNRIGGVRQAAATDWVPESKPIWFTEIGCAAVDKGTNEPNKFVDVQSSESALPNYSNGKRDDLIQAQYLHSVLDYWGDEARNPTSGVYGGPMIDVSRTHVWAWDARPWPAFPNNVELWRDGGNHSAGHWLNGRTSAQDLSAVVAEICARNGVSEISVEQLYGIVRGYAQTEVSSGRSVLQPLMLAHGLDVVEKNGVLDFATRRAKAPLALDTEEMAVVSDVPGDVARTRAPAAETAGRVRVNFVDASADYATRASEAIFPGEVSRGASQTDLAMSLLPWEGQAMAERWLAEARVARDTAKFALPMSMADVEPGTVVQIEGDDAVYRVDRIEDRGARVSEVVRIETGLFEPSDEVEAPSTVKAFVPPVPVAPFFMDLPLLTGDELPHAPHIAIAAQPWPGSVAVYGSDEDSDYTLDHLVGAPSIVGQTETVLPRAAPGLYDRGAPLRVRFSASDGLSSVSEAQLLRGANIAAIGSGDPATWEVFQFQTADLVSPGVYELSGRLRGQAGSEPEIPDVWPMGSYVVILNASVEQIGLPSSGRGLIRHFRTGPALRGYDDSSYTYAAYAFEGRGLRPLSPAHLRGVKDAAGDLYLSWQRRTRIEGDSWDLTDVPLGETSEAYLVRVQDDQGAVLREVTLSTPSWIYPAGLRAVDGVSGAYAISVAQVSDRFGPGSFKRIDLND